MAELQPVPVLLDCSKHPQSAVQTVRVWFSKPLGSVSASVEGRASFVINLKGRKANPTESAF